MVKNILNGFSVLTVSITIGTLSFIAPEAWAFTITLNNVNYELTTIQGSFEDNQALLTSQPWWGSGSDAVSAANQVGGSLGFPNNSSGPRSPNFAFANNFFVVQNIGTRSNNNIQLVNNLVEQDLVYAVTEGTPIPEPLTILGAGTAIAFGAGFKRKLAKAKKK